MVINFLPTVLMQLFEVLTTATKDAQEIAVNCLRSVPVFYITPVLLNSIVQYSVYDCLAFMLSV